MGVLENIFSALGYDEDGNDPAQSGKPIAKSTTRYTDPTRKLRPSDIQQATPEELAKARAVSGKPTESTASAPSPLMGKIGEELKVTPWEKGKIALGIGSISDYRTEAEIKAATLNVARPVLAEIKGLPIDERYAALKTQFGGLQGTDTFFNALDNAGPNIQKSFAHALTNNAHFQKYVIDNAMGEGSGFVGEALDSLYQKNAKGDILLDPKTGKPLLDPQQAGIVQDIMTTIGNNPDEDYTLRLDNIAAATKEYAESKKLDPADPEAESAALKKMVRSLREAGGNVNAFATMDFEVMAQFMQDLFSGRGAGYALSNMAGNLGLQGEQLATFKASFEPVANLVNFMIKPYVEVYKEHGHKVGQTISNLQNAGKTLGGNKRKTIIGEEPADPALGKRADTGRIVDPIKTAEANGFKFEKAPHGKENPIELGKKATLKTEGFDTASLGQPGADPVPGDRLPAFKPAAATLG